MRMLATVDLRRTNPEFVVTEAAYYAKRAAATVDILYAESGPTPKDADRAELARLMSLVGESERGRVLHPTGAAVDVIIEYSAKYDVVVVGPREPGPVERMLLGSIAARVVRQARSPILVARPRKAVDSALKVLVAVDLQNPQRVAEESTRWATRLGGRLDLVHVDSMVLPRVGDPDLRERLDKERQQYRKRDQAQLDAMLAEVPHAHRGQPRLAEGEPGPAINELAGEYDLVMLGCEGRRGVARFFLGSVAETVVRGAPTAVLVFPPHEAEHPIT